MSFNEKVVIVTGASRGIGKTLAQGFAQLGAKVIGTATSENGAQAISYGFKESGHTNCTGYSLDIQSDESVQTFQKAIQNDFGNVDILVNNAGITRDNIILRMKDTEWSDVINTNLTGVFRVTKAFIKGMVKARRGRIINISSVVGAMGNPGQTNYVAAKAGLEGFSRALARELAPRNITVNNVAPGFIVTDMTDQLNDAQQDAMLSQIPLNRFGSTEDIFNAVKFLSSDESSYVTGQTIHVNGGMHMS